MKGTVPSTFKERPRRRRQIERCLVAADDPKGPRIIVYHAHSSENYRPHPPHARGGRSGDIVQVGAVLAEGLRAEGFVVEHLTETFDHPQWSEAFAKAGEALARMLDEHRDVAAVIDVHRDATADDVAPTMLRARVGDAEAAKVLFVIGEADNPYAERMRPFAEALKRRVDGQLPVCPGACGSIRTTTTVIFIPAASSCSLATTKRRRWSRRRKQPACWRPSSPPSCRENPR